MKTSDTGPRQLFQKSKQALIAFCLILTTLAQPIAANAQAASAAAPLIQLGTQLAMQLVSIAIPVVITGTIMGVRGAAMLPGMVKEKCSEMEMPRLSLRKHKKKRKKRHHRPAQVAEKQPLEPVATEATASVESEVVGTESEAAPAAAPEATAAGEPAQEAPAAEAERPEERVKIAPARAKKKDNSDWYMDE